MFSAITAPVYCTLVTLVLGTLIHFYRGHAFTTNLVSSKLIPLRSTRPLAPEADCTATNDSTEYIYHVSNKTPNTKQNQSVRS